MKRTLLILLFLPLVAEAQSIIVTIAGNGIQGYRGDSGLAINSTLNGPDMLTIDNKGNIYFGDAVNNRIRKISASTGIITTIAGTGVLGYSGDNGPATDAKLNFPDAFVFDTSGNLYFGDAHNSRVRKIDKSGIITTIAGTGGMGYNGDGIPATSAEVSGPIGLCFDRQWNLLIADYDEKRVRKIDMPTGIISTVAGNGTMGYSGDGGPAIAAQIDGSNVFTDGLNNIYIADEWNHAVRRVDAVTGLITTISGDGTAGYSGDGGPARYARLANPRGIFIDKQQNIYFAEEGDGNIRRIDAITGVITTVAGTGLLGYSGDGGLATHAKLQCTDVFLDNKGVMYIAEAYNNTIRKVYTSDSVTYVNVCVGDSTWLSRNMRNGSWSCNDPEIATMDTLFDKVIGIKPGTVTVAYQDSTFAEKFIVTIPPLPSVTTNIAPVTCYGLNNGRIIATVSGALGPFQFAWSTGDSSSSINELAPATYLVAVSDESTKCSIIDSFTITQPDSILVFTEIKNDNCGERVGTISVAVEGGTKPYRYLWSNSDTTNSINRLSIGTYHLTVSDVNNCKENSSFQVEDSCHYVVVHDAISPNGDGINDTWIIEGIQKYPANKVQVFDKWGDAVYEKGNYNNDWGGRGSAGELLPDGTYFYLVKLNDPDIPSEKNVIAGAIIIKK